MKILRLNIENFAGLLGSHDLVLDGMGLTHIAGINQDDPGNSSNAAGKSTILEALTWGLFGEGLPRPQGNTEQGIRADEVLHDRLKKQCRVSVDLDDDGGSRRVERWRKWAGDTGGRSNGVRFFRGGIPVESLDEKETNRIICETLGISYEIWCRGVVFGQESGFNFCEATPGQRQSILTTVMGLEEIDLWIDRCRDDKRALKTKLAEVGGSLTALQMGYERAAQNDPTTQAQRWESDRVARLEVMRERLSAIEGEGAGWKNKLAALPQVSPPVPLSFGVPPELEEHLNRTGSTHTEARLALSVAVSAVNDALEARRRFQSLDSAQECPTCHQPITEQHRAACGADIDRRISQAQASLIPIKEAESKASATHESARAQIMRARESANLALSQYREQAAAYEAHRADRESIQSALGSCRAQWRSISDERKSLESAVNPFGAQVEQYREMLSGMRADIDSAFLEQNRIASDLDRCQWWDRELPRFKTWMFDSIVDTLAAEANRWLKIMSGGVIWIQISTTKIVGNRVKDELDVQVFRWNADGQITSRSYRTWSGGEKRRVALAVDLGLSRLLASRASKAYRFLALDEIDRHLDDRGKDGLRAVLDEIRAERDTVLVVTHDPAFRASFDNEISVTRSGGAVRVEMNRG